MSTELKITANQNGIKGLWRFVVISHQGVIVGRSPYEVNTKGLALQNGKKWAENYMA